MALECKEVRWKNKSVGYVWYIYEEGAELIVNLGTDAACSTPKGAIEYYKGQAKAHRVLAERREAEATKIQEALDQAGSGLDEHERQRQQKALEMNKREAKREAALAADADNSLTRIQEVVSRVEAAGCECD